MGELGHLLLVLWPIALVAAMFGFVAALNWLQFGQFVLTPVLTREALPSPEARVGHSERLPLLRAALVFAQLAAIATVAATVWRLPVAALIGAALPLAASVVPITWAERRYAGAPDRAAKLALALATVGGLVAAVNVMALLQGGGGPDAWLNFLRQRLRRPGESALELLLLCLPAVALWGIPCAISTDVRVRAGARLWVALLAAALVLGPGFLALIVLEVAYRLAARLDRRLRVEG